MSVEDGIPPAQPPLPCCRYLPFQTSAGGSQTSNRISESEDGLATPRTSQCAGTVVGGSGNERASVFSGAACSMTAETTSARSSRSDFRLSQDSSAYEIWMLGANANSSQIPIRCLSTRIATPPLSCCVKYAKKLSRTPDPSDRVCLRNNWKRLLPCICDGCYSAQRPGWRGLRRTSNEKMNHGTDVSARSRK